MTNYSADSFHSIFSGNDLLLRLIHRLILINDPVNSGCSRFPGQSLDSTLKKTTIVSFRRN
ncbi:MAG: hypothetical protein V3V31_14345 [Methylococcales bacterium]